MVLRAPCECASCACALVCVPLGHRLHLLQLFFALPLGHLGELGALLGRVHLVARLLHLPDLAHRVLAPAYAGLKGGTFDGSLGPAEQHYQHRPEEPRPGVASSPRRACPQSAFVPAVPMLALINT